VKIRIFPHGMCFFFDLLSYVHPIYFLDNFFFFDDDRATFQPGSGVTG
jgi:hypothetical protein